MRDLSRLLDVLGERPLTLAKAMYQRLKGRRDMNERTATTHSSPLAVREAKARADAYQVAIDDLCATFGVTVEELERP